MPRSLAVPVTAASRGTHGAHLVGRKLRQVFCGYDLYGAGAFDAIGQTRCRRTKKILNYTTDPDLLRILPEYAIFPVRDLDAAAQMVKAFLEKNDQYLQELIDLYPGHAFGFEEFLIAIKSNGAVAAGVAQADEPQRIGPLSRTVVYDRRILTIPLDIRHVRVHTDMHMLRFADGDAWLRASIWSAPPEASGRFLLSRAWICPVAGSAKLTEHYPGRWVGIGLAPEDVERILGSLPDARRLIAPPDDELAYRTSPKTKEGPLADVGPRGGALRPVVVARAGEAPAVASAPDSGPSIPVPVAP